MNRTLSAVMLALLMVVSAVAAPALAMGDTTSTPAPSPSVENTTTTATASTDYVFVSTDDQESRNYADGTQNWAQSHTSNGAQMEWTPDGRIVMGDDTNGTIRLLNATDGSLNASYSFSGEINSAGGAIATSSTHIYGGFDTDNEFRKIDPETGDIVWNASTGTPHAVGVTDDESYLYTGDGGATLRRHDPTDGSEIWSVSLVDWIYDVEPTESGDAIAIDGNDIVMVDSAGSGVQWRTTLDSPQDLSIGPNGSVYAGGRDNILYQLDPDTGDITGQTSAFASTIHRTAVGPDNSILTGNSDGKVRVVNSSTMTHDYNISTGSSTSFSSGGLTSRAAQPVAPTDTVSGQATTEDGTPLANATIRATGVNYNNIEPSGAQTLEDRANELLDEAEDPLPSSFDRTLDIRSNYIQGAASADIPLAYTREDIGTAPWADEADLLPPNNVVPADEPVVFIECNPDGDQGYIQNEYQSQLDCTFPDDGTVVVEQLGPDDSVTQTTRVEIDETAGGGYGDPSSLDYGQTRLAPGSYRISMEDEDVSTTIVVAPNGNPDQLASAIEEDLENEADSLTDRAQNIRDRFANNQFESATATTNSTGHYSVEVGTSVDTVAVEAYHTGEVNISAVDPTQYGLDADAHPRTVVRALQDNTDLNGSVYLPSQPQRYDAPTSDADVTLRELSVTPYANNSRYQDRLDNLTDLLENQTQRVEDLLQQANASQQTLEDTYNTLNDVAKNNDDTYARAEDLLQQAEGSNAELDINASEATDAELRARITVLEQAIQEQRNTIASQTSSSTTNDTVSAVAQFSGELTEDEVDVIAHYSNGTTRPVNDSYISVDQTLGTAVPGQGSTEVSVNEYPLGDATSVQFEWIAARDNGIASTTEIVRNPKINADAPQVDSVAVSSLAPGPSETVSIELNPGEDSDYRELVEATVYAPDGTTVPTATIENGRETEFTTSGQGTYTAQLRYTDIDGNNYTRTVRLRADDTDRNRPASARAESGPTGVFALVGDGLTDGGVTVEENGDISVAAGIEEDADVPSELHVYTGDVAANPSGDISVRVVQGPDDEAVSERSRVLIHGQATPQDGTYVYRDGRPVTTDGNQYGEVTHQPNQTLIETYTDESGEVTVSVAQPQGVVSSTVEWAEWNAKRIEVFGYSPLSLLTGGASGLGLLGLGLFARRRRGDIQ